MKSIASKSATILATAILVGSGFMQPAFAGVTLWADVELGMTQAEVEKRYPDGYAALSEQCQLKVAPRYRKGVVSELFLIVESIRKVGIEARRACNSAVFNGLMDKYGSPVATNQIGTGIRTIDWQNGVLRVSMVSSIVSGEVQIRYRLVEKKTPIPDVSSKL